MFCLSLCAFTFEVSNEFLHQISVCAFILIIIAICPIFHKCLDFTVAANGTGRAVYITKLLANYCRKLVTSSVFDSYVYLVFSFLDTFTFTVDFFTNMQEQLNNFCFETLGTSGGEHESDSLPSGVLRPVVWGGSKYL